MLNAVRLKPSHRITDRPNTFWDCGAGAYDGIDDRIDEYQRAIVTVEAGGDTKRASDFRDLVCVEAQDQQKVQGMIKNLQRRSRFGFGISLVLRHRGNTCAR
ncbi:hypothetical protein MUBE_12195 [Mycobacterium uberis]|uniref:Uncharacterized protein n=1 Tax=Mycobacterium uberis TaxID=2162698 RepID=A0A3E1HET2_9MYCO|nr:hypothetical protein MUBE_12195 [Mycobacterium uberis]